MRRLCWLLAPALALGLGALAPAPAAVPPKTDAARIAKLVKQLGSDEFEQREKASKELEAIGSPALEALREAAKSGEAEVKTRAAAILVKVERKAVAEKLLAPTKVKLTFKDTPLADAIAEFNKKSGYTITVHDPEKKLKDRKVTLDTGEVTFWEAFDKFCDKAGLVEASWQDVMPKLPPLRGGPPRGILPPAPPIVVPKEIKTNPPTPPKEAPPPKKDGTDKSGAPPAAARRPAPAQVGGGAGPVGGGFAVPGVRLAPGFAPFGMAPGVIAVVDGKPKSVPTCYAGAVRIRALKEGPNMGLAVPFPVPAPGGAPAAKNDTYIVWLEVRAEPKLQLQFLQSVAVAKATDDHGQKLEKVTPPAPPVPGGLPGGIRGGLRPVPAIGFGGFGGAMPGFGGTQTFPVPLKKGEKESKALKEFAGTIGASVVAPAEAVITADKLTKAVGKTFKGKDGGHIKVTEVKEEDGKITVKFELETPQNAGGGIVYPGGPIPIPPPPPPAAVPPPLPPRGAGLGVKAGGAPAPVVQIQIQIGPAAPPGGGIGAPAFRGFFPAQGITLVDDKGKTIAQTGGAPPKYQFVPGGAPKVEYTQEYKLKKGQKPAKLVYSASKTVTLEIPFTFKDVPLK